MYHIKDNTLYYNKKAVPAADVSTLRILNTNYAQDAKHTYCQTQVIEGLDPNTTEVLNSWVIRDHSKVLLWGREVECGVEGLKCLPYQYICSCKGAFFQGSLIEGADVGSFQVLDKHYSKDKHAIYYTSRLSQADYASFKTLGFNYASDKNHLYCGDRILETVDRGSFTVIPHDEPDEYFSYAKDKQHVYYEDGKILYADPDTFTVVKSEYAKDKQHVYRFGHIIPGALPESFNIISSEVISEVYVWPFTLSADKNSIFCDENRLCDFHPSFTYLGGFFYQCQGKHYYIGGVEPLPNCDASSFTLVSAQWAKDKCNVYFCNKKMPELDAESFQWLGFGYCKDNKNVFFEGEACEGLDAASFYTIDDIWAADKNHLVFNGQAIEGSSPTTLKSLSNEIYIDANKVYHWYRHHNVVDEIEGADSASFEIVDGIFCKDKHHVYYSGGVIVGADPKSFKIIDYSYSEDNQAIYYGCDKLCDKPQLNFTLLDYHNALSDSHFYAGDKIVPIDRPSFVAIDENYFKDKRQVIYNGDVVEHADPQSFEILNHFFTRDKERLYCGCKPIDMNVDTYKIQDDCYILDNKLVYFLSTPILEADAASFCSLGGNFSKDKKYVFYRDEIVDKANPDTFEVLNYSECKDDQYRFYFSQGKVLSERLGEGS